LGCLINTLRLTTFQITHEFRQGGLRFADEDVIGSGNSG
jgi:hypothetical protein